MLDFGACVYEWEDAKDRAAPHLLHVDHTRKRDAYFPGGPTYTILAMRPDNPALRFLKLCAEKSDGEMRYAGMRVVEDPDITHWRGWELRN